VPLYHRVDRMLGFFSSRTNWDSPTPSPADECVPLPLLLGGGGGVHWNRFLGSCCVTPTAVQCICTCLHIVQCTLLYIILVQYFEFANSKFVLLFTKLDIILSTLFLGAFCYFKMVRFLTNNCVSKLCACTLSRLNIGRQCCYLYL
jgi:hypothetical protein